MQLEGYTDLTRLTKGGMATLYKGQQQSLDRAVAIKFLSAEFLWDEQVKQFFDQESLVIARLNHPNIIHIIDRGITPKGRPYFVMEYVQGKDLTELMKQARLSQTQCLQILMQVCKGMGFAHKNGVIHRDIKPANILLDDENHVHILDFGIAWLEASGAPKDSEVVGTPDYMSPEQFSAPQLVSHLSDLYSLGVLMYEMFCGELPTSHLDDLPKSMAALPKELSQLIQQCLNVDAENRPASADEVRFELLKILKGAHLDNAQKAEAKAAIGGLADNFSLLDVINRSKYGAVYLFEDKVRHNLIVVKKRVNSHAGFEQGKKLHHIKHEKIIRILGVSKNDKAFIVVMEYLTGGSLQERLSRPHSSFRFTEVALAVCQALQFAHQNHVIHGNLRPSNILFDEKGAIKITDFGFDNHYKEQQLSDWYHPDKTVAASVDEDIVSAGLIFYQMLTGSDAKLTSGQLRKNQKFDGLPVKLQQLIKGMLETSSYRRYQHFSDLIPLLKQVQKDALKMQPSKKIFKLRHFFMILLSANVLMALLLYQMNVEFNQYVTEVIKRW